MNKVFLLGGADLEMLTIKELLASQGLCFYDKNLSWNTAVLSVYEEELVELVRNDCLIYGVELREDVDSPQNYIRIDHHNLFSDRESSLEQVASILNIKLNRWQQLVAINDKEYIGGLLSFGATQEEIENIRKADRHIQGVTQAEEQVAKQSILKKQLCNGVIVVNTECGHFSPITDGLYPYQKLLIYNADSLTYYGDGCVKLVKEYAERIVDGSVFYGGGERGFVGFNKGSFSRKQIEIEVEKIIHIVGE